MRKNETRTLPDGCIALRITQRYGDDVWTVVDADDYWRIENYRWCLTDKGYVAANTPNRVPSKVRLHRYIVNAPDGIGVDHVDNDPLNNRRSNLRLATDRQNAANGRARGALYKGVRLTESGRYLARAGATRNGKARTFMLGTYDTEEEAARAYDSFARKEWGAFARLNFPD